LRETSLFAEDGKWAVVQKMKFHDNEVVPNPISRMARFSQFAARSPDGPFGQGALDMGKETTGDDVNIPVNALGTVFRTGDPSLSWLQNRLARYLASSFFFHPFRHSARRLPSQEANRLAQDGANLVQVLATILGRDRPKFEQIERFVHAAVPGLGHLQTPPRGTGTEVGFRFPDDGYFVHLHDMGGGIEQLLMVATVLLTTDATSTLFLEEPESHLHPGAQRFLVGRLRGGGRQVFLTTHSPVLVNAGRLQSIYRVTFGPARTSVALLGDTDPLGVLLEDIGARNSDVLLSDAVLFVEGPADNGALTAWSETLGIPLAEHNVTVLTMGGGEHAGRGAPIRSAVLAGISQRAPVPHRFVLDRDERGEAELAALRKALGERACILARRELENYLLVPRAIRAAIRSKCRDRAATVEMVDRTSDEEVGRMIRVAADRFYPVILLKRIRLELGGLPGGLLPREVIAELIPRVDGPELAEAVRARLQQRVGEYVAGMDIDAIVRTQKAALDAEWGDPGRRLWLAPGEEFLGAVFSHFGTEYAKPKDAVRIAGEMTAEEIDPEIKDVLTAAVGLADRTRSL
jgi:hypothetical protein